MSQEMTPVRMGVLGLGRAFTLMVPTLSGDRRIQLAAGFDTNAAVTSTFAREFGGVAHVSAESLCADPNVEWIYVATPHQLHEEHVSLAAKHGKHVLVEKPMALSLAECTRMQLACKQAGTHLIVGHSHSFNAPVLHARRLIESGRFGRICMIHAMNFTDFLYRPRRPEELDTAQGGGVVFSQAAHQIDIVRMLGGGDVASVYARTGRWDQNRPTEGAYSAILDFESGAFASVTYNGYGYYDTDAQMGWIGEMGKPKSPNTHQMTRQRLRLVLDEAAEAAQKSRRNFGGKDYVPDAGTPPSAFQHFGPVIASCERADLRLTPSGVEIHDIDGVRLDAIKVPSVPRSEVVDELWSVARNGALPVHSAIWSTATMEVCLAILESSRTGGAIILGHQDSTPVIRP
ncbi:Gfo/Idh/MocA family protein [Hydrogenophaga taeniospiralis]|uniref:Gfo/Idh/MocA family protein n=1 Tax=Hydrogenophaga taeniospiralis TaxID=65656 RepID=UPI001CFB6B6A|nr:Gfo/Idh/MocA family oxidoreductase [Hydrogenophaga taeniospiralis]UCU94963.1 Gfo/Idh/MocA family oxidoreductase [Hydrogenophaga taeniospiralis]